MIKHEAITELNSGIVVDSKKLSGLSAAAMANFFAGLYSEPLSKRLIIVDNASHFFSSKNLLAELEKGGEDWKIICEHFKIKLSFEDVTTLERAVRVRKHIEDTIKAVKPPYVWASAPKDWCIDTHIKMDYQTVQRVRHAPGQLDSNYSVGLATLKRIWGFAVAYWSGTAEQKNLPEMRFDSGSYSRKPVIHDNMIEIGCQRIMRYEIEAVALAKGWELP